MVEEAAPNAAPSADAEPSPAAPSSARGPARPTTAGTGGGAAQERVEASPEPSASAGRQVLQKAVRGIYVGYCVRAYKVSEGRLVMQLRDVVRNIRCAIEALNGAAGLSNVKILGFKVIVLDDGADFSCTEALEAFKLKYSELAQCVDPMPIALPKAAGAGPNDKRVGRQLPTQYGDVSSKNVLSQMRVRELAQSNGCDGIVWSVRDDDDTTSEEYHREMIRPVAEGLRDGRFVVSAAKPGHLWMVTDTVVRVVSAPDGFFGQYGQLSCVHYPLSLMPEDEAWSWTPAYAMGEDVAFLENVFKGALALTGREVEVKWPSFTGESFGQLVASTTSWWAGPTNRFAGLFAALTESERTPDEVNLLGRWKREAPNYVSLLEKLVGAGVVTRVESVPRKRHWMAASPVTTFCVNWASFFVQLSSYAQDELLLVARSNSQLGFAYADNHFEEARARAERAKMWHITATFRARQPFEAVFPQVGGFGGMSREECSQQLIRAGEALAPGLPVIAAAHERLRTPSTAFEPSSAAVEKSPKRAGENLRVEDVHRLLDERRFFDFVSELKGREAAGAYKTVMLTMLAAKAMQVYDRSVRRWDVGVGVLLSLDPRFLPGSSLRLPLCAVQCTTRVMPASVDDPSLSTVLLELSAVGRGLRPPGEAGRVCGKAMHEKPAPGETDAAKAARRRRAEAQSRMVGGLVRVEADPPFSFLPAEAAEAPPYFVPCALKETPRLGVYVWRDADGVGKVSLLQLSSAGGRMEDAFGHRVCACASCIRSAPPSYEGRVCQVQVARGGDDALSDPTLKKDLEETERRFSQANERLHLAKRRLPVVVARVRAPPSTGAQGGGWPEWLCEPALEAERSEQPHLHEQRLARAIAQWTSTRPGARVEALVFSTAPTYVGALALASVLRRQMQQQLGSPTLVYGFAPLTPTTGVAVFERLRGLSVLLHAPELCVEAKTVVPAALSQWTVLGEEGTPVWRCHELAPHLHDVPAARIGLKASMGWRTDLTDEAVQGLEAILGTHEERACKGARDLIQARLRPGAMRALSSDGPTSTSCAFQLTVADAKALFESLPAEPLDDDDEAAQRLQGLFAYGQDFNAVEKATFEAAARKRERKARAHQARADNGEFSSGRAPLRPTEKEARSERVRAMFRPRHPAQLLLCFEADPAGGTSSVKPGPHRRSTKAEPVVDRSDRRPKSVPPSANRDAWKRGSLYHVLTWSEEEAGQYREWLHGGKKAGEYPGFVRGDESELPDAPTESDEEQDGDGGGEAAAVPRRLPKPQAAAKKKTTKRKGKPVPRLIRREGKALNLLELVDKNSVTVKLNPGAKQPAAASAAGGAAAEPMETEGAASGAAAPPPARVNQGRNLYEEACGKDGLANKTAVALRHIDLLFVHAERVVRSWLPAAFAKAALSMLAASAADGSESDRAALEASLGFDGTCLRLLAELRESLERSSALLSAASEDAAADGDDDAEAPPSAADATADATVAAAPQVEDASADALLATFLTTSRELLKRLVLVEMPDFVLVPFQKELDLGDPVSAAASDVGGSGGKAYIQRLVDVATALNLPLPDDFFIPGLFSGLVEPILHRIVSLLRTEEASLQAEQSAPVAAEDQNEAAEEATAEGAAVCKRASVERLAAVRARITHVEAQEALFHTCGLSAALDAVRKKPSTPKKKRKTAPAAGTAGPPANPTAPAKKAKVAPTPASGAEPEPAATDADAAPTARHSSRRTDKRLKLSEEAEESDGDEEGYIPEAESDSEGATEPRRKAPRGSPARPAGRSQKPASKRRARAAPPPKPPRSKPGARREVPLAVLPEAEIGPVRKAFLSSAKTARAREAAAASAARTSVVIGQFVPGPTAPSAEDKHLELRLEVLSRGGGASPAALSPSVVDLSDVEWEALQAHFEVGAEHPIWAFLTPGMVDGTRDGSEFAWLCAFRTGGRFVKASAPKAAHLVTFVEAATSLTLPAKCLPKLRVPPSQRQIKKAATAPEENAFCLCGSEGKPGKCVARSGPNACPCRKRDVACSSACSCKCCDGTTECAGLCCHNREGEEASRDGCKAAHHAKQRAKQAPAAAAAPATAATASASPGPGAGEAGAALASEGAAAEGPETASEAADEDMADPEPTAPRAAVRTTPAATPDLSVAAAVQGCKCQAKSGAGGACTAKVGKNACPCRVRGKCSDACACKACSGLKECGGQCCRSRTVGPFGACPAGKAAKSRKSAKAAALSPSGVPGAAPLDAELPLSETPAGSFTYLARCLHLLRLAATSNGATEVSADVAASVSAAAPSAPHTAFDEAVQELVEGAEAYYAHSLRPTKVWETGFKAAFKPKFPAMHSALIGRYCTEGLLRCAGLTVEKAEAKVRKLQTGLHQSRQLHISLPDRRTMLAKPVEHDLEHELNEANLAAAKWLWPQSTELPSEAKVLKRRTHPHALIDLLPHFGASFSLSEKTLVDGEWRRYFKDGQPPPPSVTPEDDYPFWTTMAPEVLSDSLTVFNPSSTTTWAVRLRSMPWFLETGDTECSVTHFSHHGLCFRLPPRHFAAVTYTKILSQYMKGPAHLSACVSVYKVKEDPPQARDEAEEGAGPASGAARAGAPSDTDATTPIGHPSAKAAAEAAEQLPSEFVAKWPNFGRLARIDRSVQPPPPKWEPNLASSGGGDADAEEGTLFPPEKTACGWMLLDDELFRHARWGVEGSLRRAGLSGSPRSTLGRRTHEENEPLRHRLKHKLHNAEFMYKPLLTRDEAKAHREAWPPGQGSFAAADPGNNTFLTLDLHTPDGIFAVRLGHRTVERLHVQQRLHDRANGEASRLLDELVAAVAGDAELLPVGVDKLRDRLEVEAELKEARGWVVHHLHMMQSIVDKLHGTSLQARARTLRTAPSLRRSSLYPSKQSAPRSTQVLCNLVDVFALPKFDNAGLARRCGSQVARDLMALSHGRFRAELRRRCTHAGVQLHLIREPYTTQAGVRLECAKERKHC